MTVPATEPEPDAVRPDDRLHLRATGLGLLLLAAAGVLGTALLAEPLRGWFWGVVVALSAVALVPVAHPWLRVLSLRRAVRRLARRTDRARLYAAYVKGLAREPAVGRWREG